MIETKLSTTGSGSPYSWKLKKNYQGDPLTTEELHQFKNTIYTNLFYFTQILCKTCFKKSNEI
jgi:hypothetical protein